MLLISIQERDLRPFDDATIQLLAGEWMNKLKGAVWLNKLIQFTLMKHNYRHIQEMLTWSP